ncbi:MULTISPECIES: hypothetical protein [unclassified Roseitalea]|uniref:hypothetical protein n=1 Tax=unclassified Roseitalea TaxID=2639107 RepID=UPI00273D0B25|nr:MULTISPECIES: hypothetical protein [unclassified Roseitalea]
MADIVALAGYRHTGMRATRSARAREARCGSAKVLFFTGVRREPLSGFAPDNAPGRGGSDKTPGRAAGSR